MSLFFRGRSMKIQRTKWNQIHWISKNRAFIVRRIEGKWNLLEVDLVSGQLWNWKFFRSKRDAIEMLEILLDEEAIYEAEQEAEIVA